MNDPTGLRRTFAKPSRPFNREANRSSQPFPQRKARFDPLSVQGCFNCGGNHLLKDCLKPLNTVRAASRKIEYFAKKKGTQPYAVHQVLADLCEQIDGGQDRSQSSTPITNDSKIFESLVTSSHQEEHSDTNESALPDIEGEGSAENVYFTNNVFELKATDTFLGACIDSTAQKIEVGKRQAQAYCDFSNVTFELQTDSPTRTFSFATHEHSSMGTILIRVPITESHFIELPVDVVNVQIPFLLGLDTMKRFKLVLDTDNQRLSSKSEGWDVPLMSKRGHLYYEWKPEILFTQSELVRIHKHFYHPKSERLYSLMKRGVPEKDISRSPS